MGDKATLAKARRELEGLYQGVNDDSVDLSFKDFASFHQDRPIERKAKIIETIHEDPCEGGDRKEIRELGGKSPSLDFSRGLRATHQRRIQEDESTYREHSVGDSFRTRGAGIRVMVDNSQVHDDGRSAGGDFSDPGPFEKPGGRRRQGNPHSNICAVCSDYIYIFKNRCLVCGRVYCRKCVDAGMGEMTEGRKCIECLGRRFSQRYINKAGQTGCWWWRYSNSVKQQELKWAEKGPRRSGEKQYGVGGMASVSNYLRSSGISTSQYERRNKNMMQASRPVSPGPGTPRTPQTPRTPGTPRTPRRSHVPNDAVSFVSTSGNFPSVHAFPV